MFNWSLFASSTVNNFLLDKISNSFEKNLFFTLPTILFDKSSSLFISNIFDFKTAKPNIAFPIDSDFLKIPLSHS